MASRGRGFVLGVALALGLAAGARAEGKRPVVVASKNFTENRLLGEVLAQLIEARTDIPVVRKLNLGGTKVAFDGMRSGQVDLYPEYTGTAWMIHLKKGDAESDPLRTYLGTKVELEREFEMTWLQPFGFNNTYAMAMAEDTAERLGVTRISELKPHLKDLRIGVSHEFLNREDGFLGLAKAYGFQIPEGLRGMEHGLAYEGLKSGRVDLVDAWTTDGKLELYPVRILEDDGGFFPPYDAAPLVRSDTLARHPELGPLLNRLAFTLPQPRMRALNFRVEQEGGTFANVARDFLLEQGLISEGQAAAVQEDVGASQGFLAYLIAQRGVLADRGLEHVLLTAVAVALAVGVAVPLGIALTRNEALAGWVLGAAGVIQTVPSLALLAFMIPIPGLGLGWNSAVAALFLYALLPILRNTYTGIREVDPLLLEAARGIGLTDAQILTRVELPLATRTIMAGVRTATVISVGVATLAAFIGAGGLGDPIVTGLQLNDTRIILSGAVPAAVLAVLVDQMLEWLERRLAPPGLDAPDADAA